MSPSALHEAGGKGTTRLRDINGRLAAERRQKGREACMRGSERAVRTPWRQERRQRYAQERRHLSSFKCHEAPLGPGRHQGSHLRGCARPSVWSEHSWGLHRPQKGPGTHRNPSLFFRSWPWGEAGTRPWRLSSVRERCSLLARNLPEVKEKHWFSISSETIRGCPLGDGKRGSRGCQGRARLRKCLPFHVFEPSPGALASTVGRWCGARFWPQPLQN